ncbi:MAG: Gfo/Idh/MocA family oxidoreductase, partial [Caldilineaceae bacterium]
DTLAAWLRFANGVIGSYTVTYASGSPLGDNSLHVTGTEGSLRLNGQKLVIQRSEERMEESFGLPYSTHRELAAFIESALTGAPHRNSPQEALADLAVIEAMLAAAESGAAESVASDF